MSAAPAPIARFSPTSPPAFDRSSLPEATARIRETTHVVREPGGGRIGVASGGQIGTGEHEWLGTLAPLFPEWLGDRTFAETHGTRFPYIAGAMANGIGTTAIVIAMARAGCIGFFGAAGLAVSRVEKAVAEVQAAVPELPYGFNLIHSPQEPHAEAAVADLYIQRRVQRASAAAFMALTPPLVRYSATGLRRLPDGRIERRNHVFAKISRPEVARRFMLPAPAEILDALVRDGLLSREEALLAREVPVAEDITVESDSGGHTDNRPLGALLPVIAMLRDEVTASQRYARPIRIGAAGGLGTPNSVAAAFGLGAAYVLVGSVNQSCVEAGIAPIGKQMLCKADLADVAMAPAADMFEMGVEVQVLKRGTMFAARALKLRELYLAHSGLDALPTADRSKLENEIFRAPLTEVWAATETFFAERDPRQLDRAMKDPKHKMALVFRWYLGKSSRWAIDGDPSRTMDYQLWCGPAMGAFNAWVKGSFLESAENRQVAQVARNLLEGAAVVTRAQQLRSFGVPVPEAAFQFRPRPLA